MKPVIEVKHLSKKYKLKKSQPGALGALKAVFSSKTFPLEAIHDLNLTVMEGEKIAFIGPNGAGKSTTIKMLTGILHPSSGSVKILGFVPWKQRKKLGYHIGTVFGQRTQFWHHLSALDTFELLATVYDLDKEFYHKQLNELTRLFDLESLIYRPVRQLSLGQRMRCEVVASLLHNPKVLFLDEPTIGLDVNAKLQMREFLNAISKKYGTTLFLTSHDTADIEHICNRVIVLDKGKILKDCSLDELKRSFVNKKIFKILLDDKDVDLKIDGVKVTRRDDFSFVCEVDPGKTPIEAVIHEALKLSSLKDITIEDPSMDEIVRGLYSSNEKIL